MRRGRGARIGFLPQEPQLPDGTVRDAVGEEWRGEAILDRLGMGGLLDAPTTELSGGQAKRVALAPAAGPRARGADPRRADQPPRPRCGRVPRGATGGLHRRARPRHPRSPRARPCHHEGARARPGRELPARARRPHCRLGLRRLPRRPRRAGGAGRLDGADPAGAGPARARMAAARCSGAHPQAEGAHRLGHRDRRGSPAGRRPPWRPGSVARHRSPGVEGGRAPRRRLHVARRQRGAPPVHPADRAGRAARRRGRERIGEVDPARPDRRPVAAHSGDGSIGARRWCWATTTSSAASSTSASGYGTRSSGRIAASRPGRTRS